MVLLMMVGCLVGGGVNGEQASGPDISEYNLTDADWSLHTGDTAPGLSAEGGELITFRADGSILVDGGPSGEKWDGPYESRDSALWPNGAAEFEVGGTTWTLVPLGDPGNYQWYGYNANGAEWGLYPRLIL